MRLHYAGTYVASVLARDAVPHAGSTKGPLVYLDCFDATCFPTDTPSAGPISLRA